MSDENDKKTNAPDSFPLAPGLSIMGLLATGIVGIFVGIYGDNGVALLASTLSFGLVAWLAFR